MPMETATCPMCQGAKQIVVNGRTIGCPTCKGTGEVIAGR